MHTSSELKINQLVINWHVTEVCNFRCNYCYAKWDQRDPTRDLIQSQKLTRDLLSEIWEVFAPRNSRNVLRQAIDWKRVRINFAGGEPLVFRENVQFAIREAARLGFDVSIITNGSRLDAKTMTAIAPHLDWLGVSIDATDQITNAAIGRRDGRGVQLDFASLSDGLELGRRVGPNMKVKINTVVCRENHGCNLNGMIDVLRPDKWKVLRALPTVTTSGEVSDEQFAQFIRRHQLHKAIMRVEDNSDMLGSYLMIDPHGRFYQNHAAARTEGYVYSRPILDVGAGSALKDIEFSAAAFARRYG